MPENKSIQEKLGFAPDTKLLIIHNDDLGLSHSENLASMKAFEIGSVNSGSVMVNCPWFGEIARYCVANPGLDIGVHLTLTSEWPNYKWGPVLSPEKIPSLVDQFGFFMGGDFHEKAVVAEGILELRAQVEKAIRFGIQPTHLDCHMFALYATPEFLAAYIQLGREYNLPILLSEGLALYFGHTLAAFTNADDLIVNSIFLATPESYEKGLASSYKEVMEKLAPGLHVVLIHTAFDDEEMRGVTNYDPDWGANWRAQDFAFFTGDDCKNIIKDCNIQLISWKEINLKLNAY